MALSLLHFPILPPHVPPRHRRSTITCRHKRYHKRLKEADSLLPKMRAADPLFVDVDERLVQVDVEARKLKRVAELIKDGYVGVIPTDTVYAIVCDLKNPSAIEKLLRIKAMEHFKPPGILCRSFRDIDTYTTGLPRGNAEGQRDMFRALKQCLPGPYTFILPASKEFPRQYRFALSTKHIGVRMPDDDICQVILENLDAPLVCASVQWCTGDEWMVSAVNIKVAYQQESPGLDFVVDGGFRRRDPSTVVDLTGSAPTVIRRGRGPVLDWMVMKGEESDLQEELLHLP